MKDDIVEKVARAAYESRNPLGDWAMVPDWCKEVDYTSTRAILAAYDSEAVAVLMEVLDDYAYLDPDRRVRDVIRGDLLARAKRLTGGGG